VEQVEGQEGDQQAATKVDPLDLEQAQQVVPGEALQVVLVVIRVPHQAQEQVHLQGVAHLQEEVLQEVQEDHQGELLLVEEEVQLEDLEEVHQEVQEDLHHQEENVGVALDLNLLMVLQPEVKEDHLVEIHRDLLVKVAKGPLDRVQMTMTMMVVLALVLLIQGMEHLEVEVKASQGLVAFLPLVNTLEMHVN